MRTPLTAHFVSSRFVSLVRCHPYTVVVNDPSVTDQGTARSKSNNQKFQESFFFKKKCLTHPGPAHASPPHWLDSCGWLHTLLRATSFLYTRCGRPLRPTTAPPPPPPRIPSATSPLSTHPTPPPPLPPAFASARAVKVCSRHALARARRATCARHRSLCAREIDERPAVERISVFVQRESERARERESAREKERERV